MNLPGCQSEHTFSVSQSILISIDSVVFLVILENVLSLSRFQFICVIIHFRLWPFGFHYGLDPYHNIYTKSTQNIYSHWPCYPGDGELATARVLTAPGSVQRRYLVCRYPVCRYLHCPHSGAVTSVVTSLLLLLQSNVWCRQIYLETCCWIMGCKYSNTNNASGPGQVL